MRKTWQRIFLLCMACMICMCGLCFAEENDGGNWVQYYYQDSYNIYYVDTNSIKAREYEGRKYLEVKTRTKETRVEGYVVWAQEVEVTFARGHWLFDVENRKGIVLDMENFKTNIRGGQDISDIKTKAVSVSSDPRLTFVDALLTWVEQNRPDVINEIRTFNQSAPQPSPELPGAPNDMTPSGDLHSLIYTPLQSEKTSLAFCPLDSEGAISEIYLNPYKTGREYVIVTTYPYERGRFFSQDGCPTFAYIPDDLDNPGAGGEFLFTYGEYQSNYFMRARIIDEITLKIEWISGDTQSGPQPRRPEDRNTPYSEDIYELKPITEEQLGYMNHVMRVPYRFVSQHGDLPKFCEEVFSAMFAFQDFLNEGNTLDSITEPPQGMVLPYHESLKHPERYRETGIDVG